MPGYSVRAYVGERDWVCRSICMQISFPRDRNVIGGPCCTIPCQNRVTAACTVTSWYSNRCLWLSKMPLIQKRYVPALICTMPLIDRELSAQLEIIMLSQGQLETCSFDSRIRSQAVSVSPVH